MQECPLVNIESPYMTFKEQYNTEFKKKLMEMLKINNPMAVPRMVKVVINVGAGEAVTNKNVIEKVQEQITLIAGQKAVITKAKKSVFKIIHDLTDRRGIKHEFNKIDADIQDEIIETWIGFISKSMM